MNDKATSELPKLPEIKSAELDARTKAVWQKKLCSDGRWDSFLEAKEQRRRQLRQAGFPRSEANLEAWWDVIQELDHKLEARTISDAQFWRYQCGWLIVLTGKTAGVCPEPASHEDG